MDSTSKEIYFPRENGQVLEMHKNKKFAEGKFLRKELTDV